MYHSLQSQLLNANGISINNGYENLKVSEKHTHDFDEIVVIVGGCGNQHINNESYFVTTGDVFIVKDEAIHYFSDVNNLHIYNVGFKPWVISSLSPLLLKTPGYHSLFVLEPAYRKQNRFSQKLHLDIGDLHTLIDMLDRLEAEIKIADNDLVVTALFMQITGFLCRMYYTSSSHTIVKNNPLAKMIEYIENNYTEPVSLDDLCKVSNMSKNGVISLFNRIYSTTPTKYINNLRLYKAEMLLKNSDIPITGVALECGFSDSNYFTRIFKATKGITPREYRNNSWILK